MKIRVDSIDAEISIAELLKDVLGGLLIFGAAYGLFILAGFIG